MSHLRTVAKAVLLLQNFQSLLNDRKNYSDLFFQMFLKPFRTKSSVTVRNSDRRKVKSRLGSFFPEMTEDQIGNLIPAKGDLKENKIYTHKEYFNFIYSQFYVLRLGGIPRVFRYFDPSQNFRKKTFRTQPIYVLKHKF